MKKKIANLKEYYKAHPKRFWAIGIILVLVIIGLATHKSATTTTVVPVVHSDLKQTVLATGQVTSETDLDLAFSSAGLVRTLSVSVGDHVRQGQVLATLNNGSEYAALSSAKANYQKVVDGSSNEEVAVATAALNSAKSDLASKQKLQDALVENAHRALLNADLTPAIASGASATAPTVTGTYTGTMDGSYTITPNVSSSIGYFTYSGLESGTGEIKTTAPVALGTKGLFIQFPSSYASNSGVVWTVLLPNVKSPNYLSLYNAYQSALNTRDSVISAAEDAITQAQANLDLKKASARPADVAVAQAQVDQASATYEKTVLRAPANGTVVHVDTKIGERADAQKEVVVIQDVGTLYVEANINETNIAKVALDQPVVMTLDAFGPDTLISGHVIHIDPSSTTSDGVVNYKIKVSITPPCTDDLPTCTIKNDMIRPGMNANMTITAWDHQNVIAIPKAAVTTKDGVSTVQVVLNEKKKKYETRTIRTTFQGDGNLVEVESGLSDGESILVGAAK